jgi:hypothetical protein
VRYAVRYYEHTEFFGRESDADVEITQGMALIMPGVRLEQAAARVDSVPDDWSIEPELPGDSKRNIVPPTDDTGPPPDEDT